MAVLALLLSTQAWASVRNLGTVGRTYPVAETDVLAEMQQRSAQSAVLQEAMSGASAKNYQPVNLHPLPRTTAGRTFLVDMTYTLDRDLTDGENQVIYPKGYTFNPLDYVTLAGGLVVIDGDDPDQLQWFEASPYFANPQVRLLLSNGLAAGLTEKFHRPVFYLSDDIARRLHLIAVPSVVIQKGKKIQVMEIFVPASNPGIRR